MKWFKKATVQAALINSIPNVLILVISIITVVVSLDISKKQILQNQGNFNKQFLQDSLLNNQQDSITKKQINLAILQLDILKKQYSNDSINRLRELLISKENFQLNSEKKVQDELMNNKNLAIKGVSFQTYETKYQSWPLDSLYGFKPDFIYNQNQDLVVNHNFNLLFRLVLYDPKLDSLVINLPILQTLSEMGKYTAENRIGARFKVLKEFTFTCKLENKTQFPIKLLSDSLTVLTFPFSHDLYISYKNALPENAKSNNLIIYPGEKVGLNNSFMSDVNWQLNKDFTMNLELDYVTIFGKKKKIINAVFDSKEKTFLLYD